MGVGYAMQYLTYAIDHAFDLTPEVVK